MIPKIDKMLDPLLLHQLSLRMYCFYSSLLQRLPQLELNPLSPIQPPLVLQTHTIFRETRPPHSETNMREKVSRTKTDKTHYTSLKTTEFSRGHKIRHDHFQNKLSFNSAPRNLTAQNRRPSPLAQIHTTSGAVQWLRAVSSGFIPL